MEEVGVDWVIFVCIVDFKGGGKCDGFVWLDIEEVYGEMFDLLSWICFVLLFDLVICDW